MGHGRMNTRVLVIDDDEAVRDGIRMVLRARVGDEAAARAAADILLDETMPPAPVGLAMIPFELDIAESGARGVELARLAVAEGRPYAVVFCDIRMAEMDGVETVVRIREFDRRAEVVFITAYSEHAAAAIAERAGANVAYFVKPFVPDEVRQLTTKLVVEWNKARELEELVRAVAALRGERDDVRKLVEHLLQQICGWIDTDSAALLRRVDGNGFSFDLGVGSLSGCEAVTTLIDKLNGDLETNVGEVTLLGDVTLLPLPDVGVAIAVRGKQKLTPDRRYLLEVFLENAALALKNSEIAVRLGEAGRLAAAGRALGYVLHDVRGPIGAAQMIARLLRSHPPSLLEGAEYLRQIDLELQRALELIGDTIAICRGVLHVKPTVFIATEALLDVRATWRIALEHRSVAVQVDAPAGIEVYADRPRLARVLFNLTKNAADAVAGAREPVVEVGARRVDGGTELWVADNGPGVPQEVLSSLFQPFASWGKEEGTGFGLAIVRQVMEAHGGTARYERAEGKSRFTVFFPDAR